MTEAMPFLRKCDIIFLRPPPLTPGFRRICTDENGNEKRFRQCAVPIRRRQGVGGKAHGLCVSMATEYPRRVRDDAR